MGQPQDLLPAVPPVKREEHITANGQIQLCPRVLPRQHFQREHRVIPAACRSLLNFPGADMQCPGCRPRPLHGFRKAAAHLGPQSAGCRRHLFERRDPRRHDHDLIRLHAGRRRPEVVQVAVVGRVERAAVKQNFHYFSRSA